MADARRPAWWHEVHLPKHRDLTEKVNASADFDPAAYQDALARAALGKEQRFLQAATAQAPFAPTSLAGEGRFPADVHWAPRRGEVVDKVNSNAVAVDSQAYSDNLNAILEGKQDRFRKAATAPAPYAVLRNESAELAGVYPSDYMLLSRRREVNEKAGTQEFGADAYACSLHSTASGRQERFVRAATAAAPFALEAQSDESDRFPADYHPKQGRKQDVPGKVNGEEFDRAAATASARANFRGAESTALKNRGVPGLLSHATL